MLKNIKRGNFVFFTVSIVIFLIASGLFFLLTGNENLDTYKSVNEIVNYGELNCNQHYWTLTNNINNFGEYEIILIHRDIYIFPEIENISCLGKVISLYIENDSIYIVSGTNQKVFNYLTAIIFLFFSILLLFYKKYTKLIVSLWFVLLTFSQIYFFSSFINPVINFVSLIIMATLVAISIVTFTNNELKKYNLSTLLFTIVAFAALFLDYIFIDYLIFLTVIAILFLKALQNVLKLKYYDIYFIIFLSHIGLILGGIDYPLSRNHVNYLPSVINSFNPSYFDSHYLRDLTYPYPLFEKLMLFMLNIFGLESLNFINYLSYFFGLLIVFLFVRYLFKNNWINISLLITVLFGKLAIYSFYKDSGWDERIYNNSFIKMGIGENTLITHLFEPTSFDILVLLVIVFMLNNNLVLANIASFISIIFHTYNIIPVFLIYVSFFLTGGKSLKELLIKTKRSILLLLSLPIIYFINVHPLIDSNLISSQADSIMTQTRIPMHRLFSGNISLFGDSKREVLFNIFNSDLNGFHFELEFMVVSLILIYLVKNSFLKNLTVVLFAATVLSLAFVFFFENNVVAIQIRNSVPWRVSNIIYLLGIIYLINELCSSINLKNFTVIILMFVSINIFALSGYADIDENRLRPEFKNNLIYDDLVLINPNDNYVIFNSYQELEISKVSFISTTPNFYGHPYKPLEIIEWYTEIEIINNFFNLEPSCTEFSRFLKDKNIERAIFSSEYYIPNSITNCENLVEEKLYGLFMYENN